MRRLIVVVSAALAMLGLAVVSAHASPALGRLHPAGCARPAAAAAYQAQCFAVFRVGAAPAAADAGPDGLSPADIADAYALTDAGGAGRVVTVVDAYDNPNAERDLAVYRRTFGLPPCTTANGCFAKVNQRGDADPLPAPDPGWGVEISLDLDAVSAACPQCSIRLVEADSAQFADLGAAEDTAVGLGTIAVSNSYGGGEFTGVRAFAHFYRHPGTSIVASTGDDGFGGPASFPAVLGTTIAVGGTTLRPADNPRGWRESAWSGAGSACSAYVAKPAWQHDRHCAMRTVGDVSAVADPDTGLAVYDTFGLGPYAGFIVVGGTSLSAPLIAGLIGRSGHQIDGARWIYRHRTDLNDPRSGSNGFCGHDYLCTARPGYDAPTGVGTPRGLAAL